MKMPPEHPRGAAMRALILNCLRDGLERTSEICARIDAPHSAVSTRLNYLRSLGLVTSEPGPNNPNGGKVLLWKLVRMPEPVTPDAPTVSSDGIPIFLPLPAPKTRRRRRFDERVVITAKASPVGIERDPLVAALFGAPAPLQQRNHP